MYDGARNARLKETRNVCAGSGFTMNVVRGENTRFVYLDQHRSGLDLDASLEDNITGGHRRIEVAGKQMDSRAYLGRFLFTPEDAKKKVAALSGGERARVALAKLLLSPANVLVLDEPTNDLDVSMLSSLESLLVEQERTALIVSHDRYFLDRAATAILERLRGPHRWRSAWTAMLAATRLRYRTSER